MRRHSLQISLSTIAMSFAIGIALAYVSAAILANFKVPSRDTKSAEWPSGEPCWRVLQANSIGRCSIINLVRLKRTRESNDFVPPSWSISWVRPTVKDGYSCINEEAAGWPMLSLRWQKRPWDPPPNVKYAFIYKASFGTYAYDVIFPSRIIAAGFVVNTLVFALFFLALVEICMRCFALVRKRRSGCAQCGYLLRAGLTTCSECGYANLGARV